VSAEEPVTYGLPLWGFLASEGPIVPGTAVTTASRHYSGRHVQVLR
jgi:hypothetical protein